MGSVSILNRLVTLLRTHGFVSENTCVLNGVKWPVYNYGPPGTLLIKNLQQEWWDYMVVKQKNVFPVATSLISPSSVDDLGSSASHGPADLSSLRTSLKPDLLSHVPAVFQMVGGRLPVAVAQMGICRNPLFDPKWEEKLLMGGLFHTEMTSHYYCVPGLSPQAFDSWLSYRLRWWKQFCRSPSSFTTVDNGSQPNGYQSSRIEYQFPWGPETVETVTNEGDTPLQEKEKETKISIRVRSGRKEVLPHLIACQLSLETAVVVYLMDAFQEKQVFTASARTSKGREPRQVLHLHSHLAPYQLAVATSGTRSHELRLVSSRWCEELRESALMVLDMADANTTLDQQFVRNDALGVPYTVVLNDKTLDTGVASVRGRDTAIREQVHLTKVRDFIMKHIEPV